MRYIVIVLVLLALCGSIFAQAAPPTFLKWKQSGDAIYNYKGDSLFLYLINGSDTSILWFSSHGIYWNPATLLDSLFLDSLRTAAGRFDDLDSGGIMDIIADSQITTSDIEDATILFEDWAQDGASSGQIPKWSGSAWETQDDLTGGGGGWTDQDPYIILETIGDSVGIGTATPDAKLEVVGETKTDTLIVDAILSIGGDDLDELVGTGLQKSNGDLQVLTDIRIHTLDSAEVMRIIADSQIQADDIATDAVEAAKIKENAVGSSEIADDAVGSDQIATDAVGGSHILTDAVNHYEIVVNAVRAAEIKDGEVYTAELADSAVTDAKIDQSDVRTNWLDTVYSDAGHGHVGMIVASGDTAMTGELDMGTNKIVSVVDPTANQDAATKKYVDDEVGAAGGGDVTDVVGGNGLIDDGNVGSIILDVRPGSGIDTVSDLVVVDTNDLNANWKIATASSADQADTSVTCADEKVQDKAGAMVSGNTETQITVTYQDGDGTIDFVLDNPVDSADGAERATKDGDGNTISTTYMKRAGGTVTGDWNWGDQDLTNVEIGNFDSLVAESLGVIRLHIDGEAFTGFLGAGLINDGGVLSVSMTVSDTVVDSAAVAADAHTAHKDKDGDSIDVSTYLTSESSDADSLVGIDIQTKTGNLQDDYILKVDITGADTTLQWEADATGGGNGSAVEILESNVSKDDPLVILNFMAGFDVAVANDTSYVTLDLTEDQVDLTAEVTGTLPVNKGGTGAATLTDHAILFGSGTGAISNPGVMSSGQLLIGETGADPGAATLTAGTGIDVSNAAHSITVGIDQAANLTWTGTNTWTVCAFLDKGQESEDSPDLDFVDGSDDFLRIKKYEAGFSVLYNTEGELRFVASNETADWIYFDSFAAGVPMIATDGDCDLVLNPSGGELFVIGDIAVGDTTTGDVDVRLLFATDGAWTEFFGWDDGNARFEISDELLATHVYATEWGQAYHSWRIGDATGPATPSLYFFDAGATTGEYLRFDTVDANDKFELSNDIDITGNITLSGTVDGVDLATFEATLDEDAEVVTEAELGDTTSNYFDSAEVVDTIQGMSFATGQITNQTLTKDDIDTTSSNFVFDGAYHVTSATEDSAYITIETLEDTAALRLLLAGGEMSGNITMAGAETVDGKDISTLTDIGQTIETAEITNGTIEPIDLNQSSKFNFNTGAYHVDSTDTDSAYITIETLEDTAALRLLLAGGQMSGNITMAGSETVDGRDLSDDEWLEDEVGGMLGGTETGIAVTYQDGSDNIDFVVDADIRQHTIDTSEVLDILRDSISGDATVGAGGALTIAANAIESTMIAADQVNDLDINFGAGTDQVNSDDLPAHTGDVTGGTALTIAANAVESTMIGADQVNDLDINFGTGTDQVSPADFANEDIGDISISTGSWALDNDVVGPAEMNDADHGDFTYSSGVATLDADVVAAAEMADADHGDVSWSGGVASIDAGVIVDADMANDALDPDKLVGDDTDDNKVDSNLIPTVSSAVNAANLTGDLNSTNNLEVHGDLTVTGNIKHWNFQEDLDLSTAFCAVPGDSIAPLPIEVIEDIPDSRRDSIRNEGMALHPSNLYVPGGWPASNPHTHWMAFNPWPDGYVDVISVDNENPHIACSDDGISWTSHVGSGSDSITNPIYTKDDIAGCSHLSDQELFFDAEGDLWCGFRATLTGDTQHIYVTSSSDGISWGNDTSIISDPGLKALMSPSILLHTMGTYRMWVVDGDFDPNRIARYGSAAPDTGWQQVGIAYDLGAERPTGHDLWHIEVIQYSVDVLLGLFYFCDSAQQGNDGGLYLAKSIDDGATWDVADDPLLIERPSGWGNNHVYRMSGHWLRKATGELQLVIYYSARQIGGDTPWWIGKPVYMTLKAIDTLDYTFNLNNPDALYANDAEISIDPRTSAAITITRIDITLDADPTTELTFSLKYADAFIGFANAVVIDDTATVAGVTTVTGGFGDPNVPANKCIYWLFDADPDDAITQASVKIHYTVDR